MVEHGLDGNSHHCCFWHGILEGAGFHRHDSRLLPQFFGCLLECSVCLLRMRVGGLLRTPRI